MAKLTIPRSVAEWNERGQDSLTGTLGIEVLAVEPEEVRMRMPVARRVMAWNGFLHAGSIVSLADSACGYGTVRNLPDDATGFTTIELKSNFLGTALEGEILCVARPLHRGRSKHVWDATVSAAGKPIAHFRCTQMILRGG